MQISSTVYIYIYDIYWQTSQASILGLKDYAADQCAKPSLTNHG